VWRVDGQENYDRGCGGCITVLPSVDAISEFKVGTANTDVDTGFGAAGQINISIKSGTRDFHGTLYEFLRNDKLDANNFFANLGGSRKPHLRFHNFGYNFGGPIYIPGRYNADRNKTFFFWSQEWRRLRQGRQFFVPAISQAMRNGDFSSISKTITDPTTGLPFEGNQIPGSMIDPNAVILANQLFPLPTTADGKTFAQSVSAPVNVREEILRLDHNFSEKHQVFFRFVLDTIDQTFPTTQWTGSSYPTLSNVFLNPPKVFLLQYTATVSPTMVNEASVSYARQPLSLVPIGAFQRPSNLNIPELFPDNRSNRVPDINLSGFFNVNTSIGSWPWDNVSNTFFYRDNVIWTRGTHTFTFGGTFMHFVKQQDLFGPTHGSFVFNGKYTGVDFADMLLGRAFQYSELSEQYGPTYITKSGGFYFNDGWRVNPSLTVNLGLRWDAHPHAYEERDRVAAFYMDRFNPAAAPIVDRDGRIVPGSGELANGMGIAGQGGVPRGLVKNHWRLFQPRIGIAWRPFGETTVFRVGYGLFHERIQGNDIYNVAPNPPFAATSVIFDTLLSNPGGGTGAIFPRGVTTYDPVYKIPQIQQWNFNIQRELRPGVVASVGYVGTASAYLQTVRNINQPTPDQAAQVLAGTANVNQVRPFRGYAAINLYDNGTNSNFHSLQASLRTDNWHGLSLQSSYTYGHAIDYASGDVGGTRHQDSYNWRLERASADFDRRHIAIFNYIYEIPMPANMGKGLKYVLGGWTLSGITTFQTGLPVNITLPGDNAGIGGGPYRPDRVGDPNTGTKGRIGFFNPAAFAQPARGEFGNSARNAAAGPGTNNWDISIFKNFPGVLGKESTSLQFRTEFYNAFNHTQWTSLRSQFASTGFGNATAARDARSIQLGLKLYF
jgi:hypothetical protein